MKFIDWFAGIGGFRRGMELAGHECVGFCEFDKYAVASYTAMHLCTQEQLNYISTLPLKERQKEILKEEYRNGEWYANDVRTVDARNIPDADCWCFGFPCQDISIGGQQIGFTGNRSSLFFRIMYLVGQLTEEEKPTYLFCENVRNLLSVNGGWDFARLLSEMDNGGYDAEWQILNAKDYLPQNRERVFVFGHLRGRRGSEVFPAGENENTNKILQIAEYDVARKNSNSYRVYSPDGLSPTLTTVGGGGRMPFVKLENGIRKLTPREFFRLQGWDDGYYNKAALVNSDGQLYKQAGNGITVNVICAIAEKMKTVEA